MENLEQIDDNTVSTSASALTLTIPAAEFNGNASHDDKLSFVTVPLVPLSRKQKYCCIWGNKFVVSENALKQYDLDHATGVQLKYDEKSKYIGLLFHKGKISTKKFDVALLKKSPDVGTYFLIGEFLKKVGVKPIRSKQYIHFVDCTQSGITFVVDFGTRWTTKSLTKGK